MKPRESPRHPRPMFSVQEFEHLLRIKQWNEKSRAALGQTMNDSTLSRLIRKLVPGDGDIYRIADNIDWMIRFIENSLGQEITEERLEVLKSRESREVSA